MLNISIKNSLRKVNDMFLKKNYALFVVLFCFFASLGYAQNLDLYEKNDWIGHKDVKGSKDYKLIPRFPDSLIQYYKVFKFSKYSLPTGKIEDIDDHKGWSKMIKTEGKVIRSQYSVSSENNADYVYQTYLRVLKQNNWKILFTGSGDCLHSGGRRVTLVQPKYKS